MLVLKKTRDLVKNGPLGDRPTLEQLVFEGFQTPAQGRRQSNHRGARGAGRGPLPAAG